jgi:type IV secretion system protein VirB5
MKLRDLMVLAAVPTALVIATAPAAAQGIPVFDSSTYLQTLSTVTNTIKMVEQGRQQIATATNTLNSLQKLTDVNSVASNLFAPATRNILPTTTMDTATLLGGDLTRIGSLGTLATSIQSRYAVTPSSSADTDAAYNAALRDATGSAAATAAFGENTLSLTQTRMQGLDRLRVQLDSAKDPKDVMDLQARIGVEQAQLQNDMLKMQAVQMAQAGEGQLAISTAETSAARNASDFYAANIIRR